MAEHLIGVWHMDPRILERRGITYYQEEASVSITERLPDGRFIVISRITTRVVADAEGVIQIPGCEGKTECIYDEATEGIGALFQNSFYVDWIDAGWIDDLFTISGNVMTGDDGNGLIRLVKSEES